MCLERQTQPSTPNPASGNGVGASTNGPPCHIHAGLQPPGSCNSLSLKPGVIAEHLSLVGSGLTPVSLYPFELPLNKEASCFLSPPHPPPKVSCQRAFIHRCLCPYMSTRKYQECNNNSLRIALSQQLLSVPCVCWLSIKYQATDSLECEFTLSFTEHLLCSKHYARGHWGSP